MSLYCHLILITRTHTHVYTRAHYPNIDLHVFHHIYIYSSIPTKPIICLDKSLQVEPKPSPAPPRPPPTPHRPCKKPPVPKTCAGKCIQAGHCCRGTSSSYAQPSCAMGCIVANFTLGVSECQRVCREHSGKCDWKIGGVRMSSCGACPHGCDSSDGPYECEAGCVFAFDTE